MATTNWAVPVVRTLHAQCYLRAGDRTGGAGDHLCQAPISLSPTAVCPPPVCVLGRYTRKELRESLQASKLVWVYIAIVVLLSAGLVAAVVFGVRWHRRNLAMHVMLAKHAERCGTVMGCMGDRKGTYAGLMWLRWPGSSHVCILLTDWALMARCHNSTYTHKHLHVHSPTPAWAVPGPTGGSSGTCATSCETPCTSSRLRFRPCWSAQRTPAPTALRVAPAARVRVRWLDFHRAVGAATWVPRPW